MHASQTIRTPDQRLRVFVSSTLQELAPERESVRRAVESLRLVPVMFELGARAHAPRDVYSAYIRQSHVFIGIYWQRYGWTAPGMDVSGLEDEYRLAAGMPKLLYVRDPAPEREADLARLIDDIRTHAQLCYRTFSSPDELAELVADDLALLMTERFESDGVTRPPLPAKVANLPTPVTSFVGREDEMNAVTRLVTEPDVHLVTLSGMGGVGKSRLAIEVGRKVSPTFRDGVCFVGLQTLSDPGLVPQAVAEALGLRPGSSPVSDALVDYLRSRQVLLVLDNVEQVIGAAPFISSIVERCPTTRVIATSREPLHVRGERLFPVSPLSMPRPDAAEPDVLRWPPIRLFVDRATAVSPEFRVGEANVAAVLQLCRALEGLPLAIELAAARVRVLSPEAMVERLSSKLDVLGADLRDYPERQRTLRSTIEWSVDLLTPSERHLFAQLSVFEGSFTLEAAEAVSEGADITVLDSLGSLVDKNLLVSDLAGAEPRFRMFSLVRDLASERLVELGERGDMIRRHAIHHAEVVSAAYTGLRGPNQRDWIARIERDIDNIRRAIEYFLDSAEAGTVAEMAWSLWFFWWNRGGIPEGLDVADRALQIVDEDDALAHARLLGVKGILSFWHGDHSSARSILERSNDLFRSLEDTSGVAHTMLALSVLRAFSGDAIEGRGGLAEALLGFRETDEPWGEAMALNVMCWMAQAENELGPRATYDEALRVAKTSGDELTVGMACRNLAEFHAATGDLAEARTYAAQSLRTFQRLRSLDSLAYSLETAGRIAALQGSASDGARLFAAAEAMRAKARIPIWAGASSLRVRDLARFEDQLDEDAFRAAWSEGYEDDVDRVVEGALAAIRAPTPVPG